MILNNVKLNYPEARDWMWDYCVYLGPFNKKYDLGVYVHPEGDLSAAVVYGNRPGEYISGEEKCYNRNNLKSNSSIACREAFRRAHLIGL